MKSLVSIFIAVLITSMGCQQFSPSTSEPKQMFENSIRRNATAEEAGLVVRIATGCTAFFVANTRKESLMVTARHCVQNKPENWCPGPIGQLVDNYGIQGQCLEVVASDPSLDIFMFRSSFPYQEKNALQLAKNAPAKNTRLVMIGYPADDSFDEHQGRYGALTVTENCWILGSNFKSVHESNPTQGFKDASALHNCSTYGGNSGGPMIAEKTKIALGLPFTYWPHDYALRNGEHIAFAANMAQMSDFVAKFSSILVSRGTVLVDNPPDASPESSAGGLRDNPTMVGGGPLMTRNFIVCSEKPLSPTNLPGPNEYIFALTLLINRMNNVQKYFYSDESVKDEPLIVSTGKEASTLVFAKTQWGLIYEINFGAPTATNTYPAVISSASDLNQKVNYSCQIY